MSIFNSYVTVITRGYIDNILDKQSYLMIYVFMNVIHIYIYTYIIMEHHHFSEVKDNF